MTVPNPDTTEPPSPDTRPRILCLHGGGVTAEIFTLQSRTLIKQLPIFRFVFADGPFFCGPGPGIKLVYGAYGPFRRWLRWLPEHAAIDDDTATQEVEYAIRSCMDGDAGTGPWVGLMGFSQGAKVAASLAFEQQVQRRVEGTSESDWRFAVLMAGRHPLVSFSERTRSEALVTAGEISEGFNFEGEVGEKLKVPTIHVHGLKDEGLEKHRRLLNQYCEQDSVTVVEWDGEHRVPIKRTDVDRVVVEVLRVAREQGIECRGL